MAIDGAQGPGQLRGDINVTPMIDVLLVLLIIFMVIAPALPHGMNAALPQRSAHSIGSPETPIVVQINRGHDGLPSYKINQEIVSIDDLGSHLSAIFSLRANRAMCIQGDDTLDFSTVAHVLDIGRGAGADRIGLLTSKDRI
jgi:biopolymer transport protein ExbD